MYYLRSFIALFSVLIIHINITQAQVTLYNRGIQTTISSGVTITINGNFENHVSGIDGSVDNQGTIELTGNWTNAAGNNVFTSNAGTVRCFNGNSQLITGANPTAFYNLIIDKTANNVSLGNNNNTIANILTLTRQDLVLGANTLILGINSSIDGTPGSLSYIQAHATGTVRKHFNNTGSFTYPIGDASDYTPVSLTLNSAAFLGNDYISLNVSDLKYAEVFSSDHITRYWSINSGGFSAINYDFAAQYTDADIVGMENLLYSELYNASTGYSYNPTNSTTNLLTGSGITMVPTSMVLTGSNSVTLPITFLWFKGTIQEIGTLLQWKVTVSTSNNTYTVEKSTDGSNFTAIAVIKAPSGGISPVYSYLDPKPGSGICYYRLKQTSDASNDLSYSSVIQVKKNSFATGFHVYQTADNTLIIKKNKFISKTLRLSILNRAGQIVFTHQFNASTSSFEEVVRLSSSIVAGIYFISLTDGTQTETKKILIK